MPKRSGAASAAWIPNHTSSGESTEHGEGADEPELVGDDGEDEVAVGQRQVAELAVAGADAGAGESAVGDRQEALVRLVRQAVAVAGDVEEGGEAVEPSLARDDERERGAADISAAPTIGTAARRR